jgi:hypothetical protein
VQAARVYEDGGVKTLLGCLWLGQQLQCSVRHNGNASQHRP